MSSSKVNQTLSAELKRAVSALQNGQMVLLVDDEGRENEGDLVAAGQFVTPEIVNFMITNAKGLLCMPLQRELAQKLRLPLMVQHNTSPHETAFTVSIEAKEGITTGISASDRAKTFEVVARDCVTAQDIICPGHVFPLIADPNGVLSRNGHTEGSIDLLKIAGLKPIAAICEIVKDDGSMARMPELRQFSEKYGIPTVTIAEIIRWREQYDAKKLDSVSSLVKAGTRAHLPNCYGGEHFKVQAFIDLKGNEHLAVMKGDFPFHQTNEQIPLVRLHSECLTGDVFGSLRCDCGPQLHQALKMIGESECGVLLYLCGHEGRGIGLFNKVEAYALQEKGFDTVEANHQLGFLTDMRDWKVAGAILRKLGIKSLNLMTNNKNKVEMMKKQGFEIRHRVSLEIDANPFNSQYLKTKRDRMGHLLTHLSEI